MTVIFLTASYTAALRIMFLEDFCIPFSWKKTMGSSFLVNCNSIGATFWSDVLSIYSVLAPENTWVEAANAWVFVVKSLGMRGGGGVALILQRCT